MMTPEQQYIWDRCIPEPNSGCWLWLLSVDRLGYGRPSKAAHRMSFEAFKRKIQRGREVHHKCYQPGCVNPDHLVSVTRGEHLRLEFADGKRVARSSKATHCAKGHAFAGENLAYYKSKRCRSGVTRVCRICRAEINRKTQMKIKAKRAEGND